VDGLPCRVLRIAPFSAAFKFILHNTDSLVTRLLATKTLSIIHIAGDYIDHFVASDKAMAFLHSFDTIKAPGYLAYYCSKHIARRAAKA
jgi:hypothetical protein